MKKTFYFLLAAVTIVLAACNDKNEPDEFDIQITKVQSTKIEFTITPTPNTTYDWWVVEQADMTDGSGNPRTLQEALEACWAAAGCTYDDYLEIAISGVKTASGGGLKPNSDNYVIAYQCSEDKKLTILASKSVHTLFAGELHGEFSVGGGKKVRFSQGNLRYHQDKTAAHNDYFAFAETQYSIIGKAGNDGIGSVPCTIDLFGWGTGDSPRRTSTSEADYAEFNEWGANKIQNGGNEANAWRTLAIEEWNYLLCDRQNADKLFGIGSVDGMYGIILLPDNWKTPTDVSFTSTGTTSQDGEYGDDANDHKADNMYTSDQWEVMENNGAVFLPAAGYRMSDAGGVGEYGNYWSSSRSGDTQAKELYFSIWTGGFWLNSTMNNARGHGFSVRLVREM